jgi:hypothetical protein
MRDDYREAVRRLAETGDHMSELDRAIVGDSAMQLRFRVRDQMDLRRIGVLLRQLGTRFEVLSDPRRHTERGALLSARMERKVTQNALASAPKARNNAADQ